MLQKNDILDEASQRLVVEYLEHHESRRMPGIELS